MRDDVRRLREEIEELRERLRDLEEELEEDVYYSDVASSTSRVLKPRKKHYITENADRTLHLTGDPEGYRRKAIKGLEDHKPRSVVQVMQKTVVQNKQIQKKISLKWIIIKWTIIAIASIIFPLTPILLMPYLFFKLYDILYKNEKKKNRR